MTVTTSAGMAQDERIEVLTKVLPVLALALPVAGATIRMVAFYFSPVPPEVAVSLPVAELAMAGFVNLIQVTLTGLILAWLLTIASRRYHSGLDARSHRPTSRVLAVLALVIAGVALIMIVALAITARGVTGFLAAIAQVAFTWVAFFYVIRLGPRVRWTRLIAPTLTYVVIAGLLVGVRGTEAGSDQVSFRGHLGISYPSSIVMMAVAAAAFAALLEATEQV